VSWEEEVEQVLAGLDYLINLGKRWEGEKEPYREADLTTEDGLKIGLYRTEEGKQATYASHDNETAFLHRKTSLYLKNFSPKSQKP